MTTTFSCAKPGRHHGTVELVRSCSFASDVSRQWLLSRMSCDYNICDPCWQPLYYGQAIDRPNGDVEWTAENATDALKVASMTCTSYLLGGVPYTWGRRSVFHASLQSRYETGKPCVARDIILHPLESGRAGCADCVALQNQPLAEVVEVEDKEIRSASIMPGCELLKGRSCVASVASTDASKFDIAPHHKIGLLQTQAGGEKKRNNYNGTNK